VKRRFFCGGLSGKRSIFTRCTTRYLFLRRGGSEASRSGVPTPCVPSARQKRERGQDETQRTRIQLGTIPTLLFTTNTPLSLISARDHSRQAQHKRGARAHEKKGVKMKVVGITILRTGASLPDPIPLSMACDLSSYGFFQRQVRFVRRNNIAGGLSGDVSHLDCALSSVLGGRGSRSDIHGPGENSLSIGGWHGGC
jgi:hypothetical protein